MCGGGSGHQERQAANDQRLANEATDPATKARYQDAANYHANKPDSGGWLQTAETIGGDALAAVTGQEWAIPLINAGVSAVNGGSIGQDLLAGGEALAGQELAGAVGIGSGNDVFNSALGITGDNPAGTGLPNIGAMFSSAAGGAPSTGGTTSPDASTGAMSPSGVPANTPSAGGAGGGASGGATAPPSVSSNFDTSSLDNTVNSLQNTGSPLTNSGNVGAGTVGTPSVSSNISSQFAQAAGGAPQLNTGGIDSLANSANSSLSSASGEAAKAPNSIGQFLAPGGQTLANAGNILASNPGAAISAAGLGLDALKGNQVSGAEKNLAAQASQQGQQGAQLEQYLQTGTLPPGEQAGVNQALDSAIASIKSRYASMGMSGSSAEQQDIAAAQSQAQAASAQMAEQLLATGINETGMSSKLYDEIVKNQMANDTALQSAFNNFSSAAAGGGGLNSRGGSWTFNPSGQPTATP